MNIQHLRNAVEVEKTRSITEAAENLYMSQPNLSRSIRELEGMLGISIFDRTPKGIVPTAQGEEFLYYARGVLSQFDEMTERFQHKDCREHFFKISVPRASYIAKAFARFAPKAESGYSLDYKETNALRSIRNVTEDGYDLGIVRYQANYEKYFLDTFREKGLQYRELWSFRYLVMMRKDHPAAAKPVVTPQDLRDSVEISQGDLYVPSLPRDTLLPDGEHPRRIFIYERASQFELLSSSAKAHMWVSPVPAELLERFGLTLRPSDHVRHKDVLIYRKQYMLSPMDELFLSELSDVQQELEALAR